MFKRLFLSVLILAGVATLSACNSGGGSVNVPVVAKRGPDPSVGSLGLSCDEFIKQLGSDYMFESVQVPEDYSKPQGLQIRVGYFRPKVLGPKLAVFFNGGPGGDSHSSYEILDQTLSEKTLKSQISVIYLDQRGNGCSSEYPESKTVDIAYLERLSHYGSKEIVEDAEVVRQKLIGGQKWIAFGQSYGAFVVHRYVARHPESLSKALSHAGAISLDGFERNVARIGSQVYVTGLFAQKFPEGYARFQKMFQKLKNDENFCIDYKVEDKDQQVCGLEIIDELGLMSPLGFNRWEKLDAYLKKIIDSKGELDLELIQKRLVSMYEEHPRGYGLAMTVINITDRGVDSMTEASCLKIYSLILQKTGNDPQNFYTECSSSIQAHYEEGAQRKKIAAAVQPYIDLVSPQQLIQGLSLMPPKSMYVYSGDHDTFVPRGSIEPELKWIGALVNYTHFSSTGHDGFYSELQVLQDLTN